MNRNTTLAAAIAALVAIPGAAIAAPALSYNYVQANYIDIEFDDIDPDADGWSVSGSGLLNEQIYAFGSYTSVETDTFSIFGTRGSLEVDEFAVGLGFRHELQRNTTDLNLEAAFLSQDVEGNRGFSGLDDDDNGYELGVGIRHLFTPQFEGNIGVRYEDIFDDDDTFLNIGGLLNVTQALAVQAGYSKGSDAESWEVGLRLNF